MQALPGIELIINDLEYYSSGDKGRVCRTSYVDDKDGIERFEITWYRTGRTSTMKTGMWCGNFRLLGRAKHLIVGDEVQVLPGILLNVEGKEYYRQGDFGKVSTNTYITPS